MVTRSKIDSSETSLSFAYEDMPGVLPATPIWHPLEPNSYDDFGIETTLTARNPINRSRQRKKGRTTDIDASGGINQDLTNENTQAILPNFMFAEYRTHGGAENFAPAFAQGFTVTAATDNLNIVNHGLATGDGPFLASTSGTLPAGLMAGTPYWVVYSGVNSFKLATTYENATDEAPITVDITDTGTGTHTLTRSAVVDAVNDVFSINNPDGFNIGSLIFTSGFAAVMNNGLFEVDGVAGNVLAVTGSLATEAVPPVNATISNVGFRSAVGDVDVDANPGSIYPAYTSTVLDFTTLDLIPGEWVFVGGDGATAAFTNPENNGFKRVRSVTAKRLEIDQSSVLMSDEANTTKTVDFYFGRVLKNEDRPLIVNKPVQLERQLGQPESGSTAIQAEYLIGSYGSELTVNIEPGDNNITIDLSFMSMRGERRTYLQGIKGGTRKSLVERDAYNATSDIKGLRLAPVSLTNDAPDAYFAYFTDISLSINNNLSMAKAVGVLGGFDVNVGTFEVSAEGTGYFSTITAIDAVERSTDASLHICIAFDNTGIVMDIPLLALGDGRPEIEIDEPVMIPLSMAAGSAIKNNVETDYTLLWVFFPYLPTLAE